MRPNMKSFLKEPLLHFLLLGAALFAFDALRGERAARAGDDLILVSRARIENLAALYAKTWQRPPTGAELRGLVDDFVLEEALYREGKVLGLDQDDTIVRRRVRQKMEFMVDDIIELAEPSEAQLEQWLAEHSAAYRRPAHYRFRQLYLSPERHGTELEADAERILAELGSLAPDADPLGLGDPTLLEHAFADASAEVVVASFGEAFAEGLEQLPIGEWSPVWSTFGLHLVIIDTRIAGEPPRLDEVRSAVERDWAYEQREQASEGFEEGVLARYRVRVEWPAELDDSSGVQDS